MLTMIQNRHTRFTTNQLRRTTTIKNAINHQTKSLSISSIYSKLLMNLQTLDTNRLTRMGFDPRFVFVILDRAQD